MDPSSITSSQLVVKAPTTLDKVPEDVQLAIIKVIQSWKRSEGTEQEREKGKRARDSSLRAVALSCRNLLAIYQRELLLDVTLNFKSLFTFYLLLERNRDARKFVTSITIARRDSKLTQEKRNEAEEHLEEDLKEVLEALTSQAVNIGGGSITVECVVEGAYRFLSNIQTLVIHIPEFNIPFQSRWASARLPPLPFLTHSLKKLYIPLWGGVKTTTNLKARNVVWILMFCTGLRSASLCCIFDQNDFKYLVEFSDTFSGLSEVRKLSLGARFSENDWIQKYWDREVGNQWIGGNKKTQAIFNLLKITKNLQCLEINKLPSVSKEETNINSSCLSALRTSYSSLESIRLFGLGINYIDPEEYKANSNFTLFQNLKVIFLDATMLVLLARITDIEFPHGLKVLCCPYYSSPTIQEDLELARALKVRSLPKLEVVIIPSTRIFKNGTQADSEDFKKHWLGSRRELEKAEIFQSGKVKLRLIEPGELIGESSETDFMSTLTWLSPP